MGKASSNKKIARAQRAGAKSTAGRERSLLYPASLTMVFVLGILLVVVARAGRDAEATGPPTLTDHWHAAYSVVICGDTQVPLGESVATVGIHTHGDGLIHIHPTSENGAGEKATLEDFFESAGIDIDDDSIAMPGGETFTEEAGCDGAEAQVRVARWLDAATIDSEDPQVFTENFDDVRFLDDREAFTIFFGPPDADIPPPDTLGGLDEVSPALDPTQQVDPATGLPIGSEGPDGVLGTDDDIITGDDAPAGEPGAEGEPSADTSTDDSSTDDTTSTDTSSTETGDTSSTDGG